MILASLWGKEQKMKRGKQSPPNDGTTEMGEVETR